MRDDGGADPRAPRGRENSEGPYVFLSTVAARPLDRRLALAVVAVSAAVFALLAPFARVQLAPVWAFIPAYQSALALSDLITAVLLYVQFPILRSRALLALAAGYLFTALIAVAHALTFPDLFAPGGLLGAGPQTTAWLYMFWHAGFPLAVIFYALVKNTPLDRSRGVAGAIATSVAAVLAGLLVVTLIATVAHAELPAIMRGNNYTPAMIVVVSSVWGFSVAALAALWWRRPHSVLDVWLMVVMCVWLADVALAAVLNGGRFDLGFYAGRIYGLLAATFVLMALLIETSGLYAELARLFALTSSSARAEIAAVNARLNAVLESSPLATFSLDKVGRVMTWNAAAERAFGYRLADVKGSFFARLPETESGGFSAQHKRVVAGERLDGVELRWPCGDGRVIDVVWSGAPIREGGARIGGAVYLAEDVTEKRKLERQLAQSQRLEAVGQLTGGMAHDFNNLLTVIIGNLEMTIEDLPGDDSTGETDKLCGEALDAAVRGAELVRRLLAFSRNQPLAPRRIDAAVLLGNIEPLLARTLGENVRVRMRLGGDIWPVLADPSQLESAVLNLAINARDAMPKGGVVMVSCENAPLDYVAAEASGLTPGDYVMISVGDTGSGIAPDMLGRVFEPFFTTKEMGKGSGLGLSMVYGFARQSGGIATIYSEIGHGTEVRLYLPRGSAAAAREEEPREQAPGSGGGERILVVEDKPNVRKTAVALIEGLGYRSVAAANAEEALGIVAAGQRFDLLFTDVVMPGKIGGIDLAKAVRRRFPGIAIVFTTGFSNPEATIAEVSALGATVISKPYRKGALDEHLRRALAGTRVKERA